MSAVLEWLDELPIGLLLVALFTISLLLAVVLSYAADRLFESEARSRTSTSMTTAVGVVAALYAVLAAFVIVNEWQAFNDAQTQISRESSAISAAYANASVLPEPARSDTQRAIVSYTRSVVCDELPYLHDHEGPSPRTRRALQALYTTVANHDVVRDHPFYVSEVQALSDLTEARKARINSALAPIPNLLLAALVVSSFVLIATISALDTQHRRWHIAITTALCMIVTLNLVLVITLDRPFDGAATVNDAPLREGVPAAVLRCDPG